ncbi:gamma-tubulin complex component 3 homolog isoform X2 [Corticium candelabrum]|nr:gamma-tubulin complex component 3 homolog isoform X2 [Corticium candelabrum]
MRTGSSLNTDWLLTRSSCQDAAFSSRSSGIGSTVSSSDRNSWLPKSHSSHMSRYIRSSGTDKSASTPSTIAKTVIERSTSQLMHTLEQTMIPLQSTPMFAAGQSKQADMSSESNSGEKVLLRRAPVFKPYSEAENTSFEVTEADLVRDIVYVLQGIDGKYVKFDAASDMYKVDSKVGVPQTVRDLVGKLAELGWLYRRVNSFVAKQSNNRTIGLVGQSFCAALAHELSQYYQLISVLQSQQGISGDGYNRLTLRRLVVWTYDPVRRLKVLATLVDASKGLKGGALASAIHLHLHDGDPFNQTLVGHILRHVARPLRYLIDQWVYEGELCDIYDEFFVACDVNVSEERLWYDKYSVREAMLPSFVPLKLAQKILLIGKSINFLRHACHERGAIGIRAKAPRDEGAATVELTCGDIPGSPLHQSVDLAYRETSKRLLEILHTKYKFMDHLKALRRYLLLGQGDFIRHLMDLLEPDLVQDASLLYLYNLTGTLESAVRSTNAQFEEPDILKRLDVRLLELSPGDTGWDVFSLDYHVDGPISTVFTRETMLRYLRTFNFLWRAKRMEHSLSSVWKTQASYNRQIQKMTEMAPVLYQCHLLTASMMHFVHQMQYYITFEVLECGWADLEKAVGQARDLDQVISAHTTFLDNITSRALLHPSSQTLLRQLRTVFDLIVQFQRAQDDVYTTVLAELKRRDEWQQAIDRRGDKGQWGVTESQVAAYESRTRRFRESELLKMRARLGVLSKSYEDTVQQFLASLSAQEDVNLRFLCFRLDFNEHYRSPRLVNRNSADGTL